MGEFDYLKNYDIQKKIDSFAKKYKNKKIVIYGAGKLSDFIFKNYNLSKLNIIAVADKKFSEKEETFNNIKGIAPVGINNIDFSETKIDFVKIDVESMEIPLLKGAKQTLLKYKPSYIFIESEYQIKEVTSILNECGYEKYEDYPEQNWLFKLKEGEK